MSGYKRNRDMVLGAVGAGAYEYARRNFGPVNVDQDVRPANHVSSGTAIQFRKGKRVLGRRPPTKMQRLLRFMAATQAPMVCRFQRLSQSTYLAGGVIQPLNEGDTFFLSKKIVDPNVMAMPVYCFNLTSLPHGFGSTQSFQTCPMYRLKKLVQATGAADAVNLNYFWEPQTGQQSDGISQSSVWNIEKITGALKLASVYSHDWTNIGMSLVGAAGDAAGPYKIHIKTVQFRNRQAAPARTYTVNNGVSFVSEDVNINMDDRNRSDLFWDKFLSTKTVHPLRSSQAMTKNVDTVLKVLSSECVCVDGPSVFTKRIFHNGVGVMSSTNDRLAEDHHRPDLNTGVVPNYNYDDERFHAGPFPHFSKDIWLLIACENFNTPLAQGVPESDNTGPRFDINVRGKWTVNSQYI